MNLKQPFERHLSLLACVAILPIAAAQSTFNLAADFSATQNPNGVWSFGWMASSNSFFNLYPTHVAAYGLSLNEWHGPFPNDNGTSPPDVVFNPTDAPITVSDTTWLPHQVTFHPGQQGERSVIRWTAPFAGPASLAAVFEGRSGSATSGVEIYQNSTPLFSGAILGNGAASQVSVITKIVVNVGDTIDFRVNYGNGNWASDTTQIGASITPASLVVVPPGLQVPPGNTVSFHAYAVGVQVYDWRSNPTNPAHSAWVLKAPTAALFDRDGKLVGYHGAGPMWEIKRDRSEVEGVLLQRMTRDTNAIPWLLLQGTNASSGRGLLANTTFIQRVNTAGGLAPATAGDHAGQQARIPYTAEYYFYRAQ